MAQIFPARDLFPLHDPSLRRRSSHLWLLSFMALCAGLFLPFSALEAATLTVGAGVFCEFDDLQDAIDAAGEGDRIELEAAIYSGPFEVLGKSLSIIGGFDRCGGDRVLISQLRGYGTVRVLEARAHGHRRSLNLQHLYLTGGFAIEGGGIAVYGSVDLTLEKAWVVNNEAYEGGGIFARPLGVSSPSVHIVESEIAANRAVVAANGLRGSGGGIYYWHAGNGAEQLEIVDSLIDQNSAESYGGGVRLINATLVVDRGLAIADMAIEDNRADIGGGGIAAWNSRIELDGIRFPGAPEIGLEIRNNWAFQDGGAVLLRNSTLASDAVAFVGNTAQMGSGGAIAGVDGSVAVVGHKLERCGEEAGCNVFENNVARVYGGALMLEGSTAALLAVRGKGNAALAGGTFIDARNSGAVQVWSSALTGHQGPVLIYAHLIDSLDIRSSTLWENDLWWTTIRPNGVTRRPTISESIFYDNGGLSHVFGDKVYFSCNMIAGLLDWPSIRRGGFEAFPRFIGDTFRLEPGSPGNGCGYNSSSAPVDIDYEPRPSGLAFEVGADER